MSEIDLNPLFDSRHPVQLVFSHHFIPVFDRYHVPYQWTAPERMSIHRRAVVDAWVGRLLRACLLVPETREQIQNQRFSASAPDLYRWEWVATTLADPAKVAALRLGAEPRDVL